MVPGKFNWKNLIALAAFTLATALSGCGKKDTTTSTTSSNPAVGQVTTGSMYVRVYDESNFPYYVHTVSNASAGLDITQGAATAINYSTDCSISSTASSTDLQCMIHVMEQDLWFHGLKMQVNVPAGMCYYLVEQPYYYFNYAPGVVGGQMTIDTATTTGSCTVGCVGSPTGPDANGYFTHTSGEWKSDKSGVVKSIYDYTDSLGPQCTVGTMSVNLINSAAVPPTSNQVLTDLTKTQIGSCLGGGIMFNGWSRDGKSRFPDTIYTYVNASGVNKLFEQKGVLSTNQAGNTIQIANHYNYANTFRAGAQVFTYSTYAGNSVYRNYRPQPMNPIQDYSGDTAISIPTNNSYRYLCLDRAGEVKHRIRIWVNEWNTLSEFTNFATTAGHTVGAGGANPNITGNETSAPPATDCDYLPGTGYVCNDFIDWDDAGFSGPAYGSAGAYTNQFPREPDVP